MLQICRALVLMLLMTGFAQAAVRQHIDLGDLSVAEWNRLLKSAAGIEDVAGKIAFLSTAFLETPYRENSLIGSPEDEEVLVLDLSGLDCFTLLDYVESFRRSPDYFSALEQLKRVRYREGRVEHRFRNHFFSEWQLNNARWIEDVTARLVPNRAVIVHKLLNRKPDATLWIAGVSVVVKEISYIPAARIDHEVFAALKTGDYLGIYSERPGLDVSHTGIVIRDAESLLLRHASSREGVRRVVDTDLLEYLQGKPGILVFRTR